MPMEDSHHQCVHSLGLDHACMATQDAASYMNSFILPPRVKEARDLAFPHKGLVTVTGQLQQAKQPRIVVWNDHMGMESLSLIYYRGMEARGLTNPSATVALRAPSTTQSPIPALVEHDEVGLGTLC